MPDAAQLEKDQRCLDQADRPEPDPQALVDVCRLLLRYDGGSYQQIADHALAILEGWGLDRDSAFARCRAIWESGFRPVLDSDPVGSGSDANAS
jgi:hypothetical protein